MEHVNRAARRRLLFTSVSSTFVTVLFLGGLAPLYPDVARDLRLHADGLGMLVGLPLLVSALISIPAGVAVDQFGARPFMAIGLLLLSLAQILRWLAVDQTYFAAGQIALGISLPFCIAASLAAVANAYPGGARAEALGYVYSGTNLGQIAGFIVVGVLGAFMTWRSISIRSSILPLMLLPFVLTMPEAHRPTATSSVGARLIDAIRFLVHPRAARLAAVAAFALAAATGASYLLPFELRRESIGPTVTGILLLPYVVGALVGGPIVGRIADRTSPLLPLRAVLLGGATASATFAAVGPYPLAVAACFFVLGASTGGVLSVVPSQVVDLASRAGTTGTGAALGGLRLSQTMGPAVGPVLIGFLFIRIGALQALFTAVVVLLLALMLTVDVGPNPAPNAD